MPPPLFLLLGEETLVRNMPPFWFCVQGVRGVCPMHMLYRAVSSPGGLSPASIELLCLVHCIRTGEPARRVQSDQCLGALFACGKHTFHSSWKAYVSRNILTLHMKRVIQQFLYVSRVCCKDDILDAAEAKTIPPLKLDHTQVDTALNTKTAKKGVNESKDKQISSDSVSGIKLAHEAWHAMNLSNMAINDFLKAVEGCVTACDSN